MHHYAPRPSANYGELIPGAISHEAVQKQFNSFFSKHRRNYGSQLIKQPDRRGNYSIPCIILKVIWIMYDTVIMTAWYTLLDSI